jgi:hypothetical protein
MRRHHWSGDCGQREEVWLLWKILEEICEINDKLSPVVTGFSIKQTGDPDMALTAPDPGATLVFTATPTPAGSALPAGVVPTWTSSDPTNAPVTADPTGLIGTVILSSSITVGESVTLTITATLPDGTTPTGSTTFTVGATPPVEVTGFTIVQTT